MADFSGLAKLINEETQDEVIIQEAQPMRNVIDNSATEEFIEKARQSMIGEKGARERIDKVYSDTTRTQGPSFANRGSLGSNAPPNNSSGYRSPYGSNIYNKTESEKDKAVKYSINCVKASIECMKKSSGHEWDIVSSINYSTLEKRKSPAQLLKEEKKRRRKEGFAQFLLEFGRSLIEGLYPLERKR